MIELVPPRLHRMILRYAYRIRSKWRSWRKVPLFGCSIIIEDEDGRVLLQRHSYGPQGWALPGGGLKSQEDPARGVRREIAEELGMEVEQLELIGTLEEQISASPHTDYVFRGLAMASPVPDQREVAEASFFAAEGLPEGMSRTTQNRLALWRRWRAQKG